VLKLDSDIIAVAINLSAGVPKTLSHPYCQCISFFSCLMYIPKSKGAILKSNEEVIITKQQVAQVYLISMTVPRRFIFRRVMICISWLKSWMKKYTGNPFIFQVTQVTLNWYLYPRSNIAS
jgi:hypothetical protein